MFCNESGIYANRNWWNVKDATEGNSAVWHEMYSHGRTEVVGYVAPRATSALTGMGACERSWGNTKAVKTDQHVRIGGGEAREIICCLVNIQTESSTNHTEGNGEN